MSMDTDTNPAISFLTSGSEIVTATHEFKVMGYSLYKDFGVRYVESKKFTTGGYEWTIRFYPNGENDDSYVSLYVALATNETDVKALFELTFVDQSGRNQHYERKTNNPRLFGRDTTWSWGFRKFYQRSLLATSDYIKDDCLLIRCRIWVLSDTIPPSNIGQQIGRLLESGEGADIQFKVGRETFAAHKFVLVLRSPVFKAKLAGPMKDDDSKECIEITDMEAAVFKTLLHFIYWDALPDDLEHLFVQQHLLVAADRYGIERLRMICEAKLCKGVTVDTAATTLALAEQHHCLRLKSACLEFIAQQRNLETVMQTEGFTHLQSSCPSVVRELERYIAGVGEHSITSEANASQV